MEDSIELYNFKKQGTYAIIGRCYSGKTELAKHIITHKQPTMKYIFTHCPYEWEEYSDDNTRVVTNDMYKTFQNIWENEGKNNTVFLFDDIEWDGQLEQSKMFHRAIQEAEQHNVTIIICYNPDGVFQRVIHIPMCYINTMILTSLITNHKIIRRKYFYNIDKHTFKNMLQIANDKHIAWIRDNNCIYWYSIRAEDHKKYKFVF